MACPPFKPKVRDEWWARRKERLCPPYASRRGGVAERGDDVIDHFLDQDAVVALAHHANHRFGAGGADQQPVMTVEPLLAIVNRRLDLGGFERLAAAVAHVFQDLRQRIEAAADV